MVDQRSEGRRRDERGMLLEEVDEERRRRRVQPLPMFVDDGASMTETPTPHAWKIVWGKVKL